MPPADPSRDERSGLSESASRSPDPSPFLQLRGLAKRFPDGTSAVRGIDLDVARGEFVVLLGPSGCGKTTTLRMIAGLERATRGTIILNGRDVTRSSPGDRDIGFVFQSYALYPGMTVRDNLAFPLRNVGTPEAGVREALEREAALMGLTGLLDRFPAELSGGDRQRVALARALVRRPQACLMDEPLGTMDADRRQAMLERIRETHEEHGFTTLYVTHDQEEAMSLADRIVVMEDGGIRQVGAPEDVYLRPANLFVAGFLGSPGMNVLRGHVAPTPHGRAFVAEGGGAPIPISAAHVQGPALLGIRPEKMRLATSGHVAGIVTQQEFLGAHRLYHVNAAAGRLVVRVPAGDPPPAPGGAVHVTFDPADALLFHPETRERLA